MPKIVCHITLLFISLFMGIMTCSAAGPGIETYHNELKGQIKKGDILIIKDEKFEDPGTDWSEINNRKVTDIITLSLDKDEVNKITKAFTAEMKIKVEYWSQPNQAEPGVSDNIKLKVTYDPATGASYQSSADHHFGDSYKVRITVEDFTSEQLGNPLPAAFHLKGQVIVERSYKMASTSTATTGTMRLSSSKMEATPIVTTVTMYPQSTSISYNASLEWNNVIGAQEYDLEWTYIYLGTDYGRELSNSNMAYTELMVKKMFKNNATRVTVQQEKYDITLTNYNSYLLIRVRPVTYDAEGNRDEGDWSYELKVGDDTYVGAIFPPAAGNQSNFNWSYDASYAEDGKRKEVIHYLDGSLRERQAVTLTNTENKAIVEETLYDEFGRPILNTMAAPVNNSALKYYEKMHRASEERTYDYTDVYNNTDCIGTPAPMISFGYQDVDNAGKTVTIGGPGLYYSSKNPFYDPGKNTVDQFTPDAAGYPFSVTRYTPDNTGRVSVQGGVGALFQPGPDQKTSKAVRMYYGAPDQWELDRLFGNDVGFASHYLKTMTVDGNGQVAISYSNASGKVIASALAGDTLEGMDWLPNKPAPTKVTAIILDSSQFKFDASRLCMSAVKTYLNAVPGPVTISYDIAQLIKTYESTSVKICSNCYYELDIKITDDCNAELYHNSSPIPVGSLTSDCSKNAVSTGAVPELNFGKVGPYNITFTLSLSQAAIDNYTNDFVSKNSDLRSQWSFVYPALNDQDLSACFDDCSTCLTALGAKVDFVQRIVNELKKDPMLAPKVDSITDWAGLQYDALLQKCKAMQVSCGTSSCDDLMHVMLKDVSPQGQYALFDPSYAPLEKSINVLYNNWRIVFPVISNTSDPIYQKNLVELGDGVTMSANDPKFTLDMLVKYWKPEWDKAFLQYHPEYCALQFCEAYAEPRDWDERLKNVAQGVTNLNLILPGVVYSRTDPNWLVDNDPFFKTWAPDYRSRVIADLQRYTTVAKISGTSSDNPLFNKSLKDYVDYVVYCADGNGNTNSVNQGSLTSDNWTHCTPVESCRLPDVEFRTYRDLYLDLKQQYYQEIRTTKFCNSACSIGDPIGFVFSTCAKTSEFEIVEAPDSKCDLGPYGYKVKYSGAGLMAATTIQFYYPEEYVSGDITTGVTLAVGEREHFFCMATHVPANVIRISKVICNNSSSNAGNNSDAKWDCGNWNKNWFNIIYNSQANPKSIGITYVGPDPIPAGKYTYVVVKAKINNEGDYKYGAIRIDANTKYDTWSPENPYNYSLGDYSYDKNQCDGVVVGNSERVAATTATITTATTTATNAVAVSSCNDAYRYKLSRITNVAYGSSMNIPTNAAALTDSLNLQLARMVHSNCETMADDWMTKLDACLNSNTRYLDKKGTLKAALIEICAAGGDTSHPYGASTTPNNVLVGGYSSFKDAIMGILGMETFSMICNPWLIDAPYPYNVEMQASEKIVSKTNFAICNRISSLKKVSNTAAGDDDGFYNWLTNHFGDAMTLSKADLTTLINGCGNCRFLLSKNIKLPVFFDGYAKAEANYSDYTAAVNDFKTAMGGTVNEADANYPEVFTNYMNQRWGFTLTYSDYVDYKKGLTDNINAVLVNKVAYPTVAEDPYSCMIQQVNTAAATGYVLYKEFIDEVKRVFRKDYIAYCGSVKPTVKMNGSQQIYHHTLYYYDQAGNLVRTVPPEGVHLVSESLFSQIDRARLNADPVCTYNGPSGNSSVDAGMTALTNLIALGTNSAMEFWTYSKNTGSAQFLTTSGSNKYLVNLCLDGRYAHLEMYSMTVTGGVVDLTQSYTTDADMQAILPLGQWTHVVVQGNGMANDNLTIYVNGVKCPTVKTATPGGCGWELASGASAPVLPQNLTNIKHMRLYSRLLTESEIATNAMDACMAAADKTRMDYWFKYNTPASGAGSAGASLAETTITPIYPGHTLTTSYAYQSLNGPTVQVSPDGGLSQSWSDYLGRVSAAQNAEQKKGNRYSYTSFDEQNRIVEMGEKSSGNTMDASVGFVPAATVTAFAASGTNSQIMHTWYDKQYDGFGYTQENLRKRVSARSYQDGSTTPQMTYYSYDQIGMVKTLWQKIDGLDTKQIEYNYDLASGKVNKLRYQHLNNDNSMTDQFYYGYEYDADNRVVKSLTGIRGLSTDGWEIENPKTDAHYYYYLHGPLARTELGNNQLVQGIDYAYTLQGWIKSVNGQYLSSAQEMGMDGLASGVHSVVAPDVFGYTLDYFNNDYKAIINKDFLPLNWGASASRAAGHDLFNGNVSRMTVASAQFGNTVGYSYRYDQLNRMKAMRQHPLTPGATSWDASTAGTAYQEDVTYDGNGNILTYKRNGSGANGKGVAMDQLTYGYNRDASGYLTNNKLTQVSDGVTTNDYGTADLKSQSGNNYGYDLIGNMVSDVQGGVSNITWTIYGKIKKIAKSDGSTLEYKYDADGNRVCKVYTHGTQVDKTWYVRDASGNVLAVYGNKDGDGNVYWKEQQLYGSSRLGSWYPELKIGTGGAGELWGTTNKKQYELTNHLGNVLATVSDELKADNTALVMSANDYYPFGMIQPDRSYSSGGYRYGFNGKENDNEVKGDGNQQDYGMRVYDPRVGRFLSVDPLTPKFPELTPYQFAGNKPIWCIDLDGGEDRIITLYTNTKGQIVMHMMDGKNLLASEQVMTGPDSYPIYHKITQREWCTYRKTIYDGFIKMGSNFASGYDKYSILGKGTLTIANGNNQTVLQYDPNPVKDDGVSISKSFKLGWKAAKMFNIVWPLADKSVEGSSEFANTIGNVQTMVGLVLTLPGMGWASICELASSASVMNGVDDMSANFTKDGKTLLEKGLGNKDGRIAKGVLSGFGAGGSAKTLLKDGFNIMTVKDAVGGTLDAKTTADNAIKSASNGN